MSQHTPKTWKYALAFENNAPNYYAVCAGNTFGGVPVAKVWTEADAKLIAAAPQLLEALREMVDEWLRADKGTALGMERCIKAGKAIKDATS